tara:strand:+ start:5834 stop:6028 length:195 start_codon:yes stop_codon:yes gene_type:complete
VALLEYQQAVPFLGSFYAEPLARQAEEEVLVVALLRVAALLAVVLLVVALFVVEQRVVLPQEVE